jgi:sugar phosphate isomerase/epimerase
MNHRIGIEFLSVFDLPPVDFVELTARLGCSYISLGLSQMGCQVHDYPAYSLRDNKQLRKDVVKAMDDCGVSISLGEGFGIKPNADVADLQRDLEIVRELGGRRINTVAIDPDQSCCFDQLARLAEMARSLQMETTLEWVPGLTIGDLPTALAALDHVASEDCRLLVDTMHCFRSGATIEDMAALDPARIGYAQICDVPSVSSLPYMEEAMFDRKVPGEGDLPLQALFGNLPWDIPVGIEIPRRTIAQSGATPYEYLLPCVEATDRILSSLN